MDKQIKCVPSREYTEDYFLNFTDGSAEFKRSLGKVLTPRCSYSLKLAEIRLGMKVLDVGCGRGEVLIYSAKQGAEAVGVDYASAAIKLAKKAIAKQPSNVQKRIKLIQRDVCKLPFDNEMFDRVFFLDVIEHLTLGQGKKALSEVRRVLKKDGLLILHTWPNQLYVKLGYPYWSWLWMAILTLLKGGKKFPPRELEPSPYDRIIHVNVQNYFTFRKMLKEAGLKTRFILKLEPLESASLKNQLLYSLYKLKPFSLTWPLNIIFCDHLWVVAKKNSCSM